MAEPLIHLEGEPHDRRPLLGYAMVWTAAALFAVNGTVSKVVLDSAGLSTVDLTQARSIGAFVGFAIFLALARPGTFRIGRRELLYLAVFGVAGVALVQWLYFVAINRLPIGIALLIQYLAPLIIALWARYVFHEHGQAPHLGRARPCPRGALPDRGVLERRRRARRDRRGRRARRRGAYALTS